MRHTGEDANVFRPKLTFYIQDGVAVDASLSPETRAYLEALAFRQGLLRGDGPAVPGHVLDQGDPSPENADASIVCTENGARGRQDPQVGTATPSTRRVEVPLTFDTEFFDLLRGDLTSLDSLQAGEQKLLTEEIQALGKVVTLVASPDPKPKKTDLYAWRELFDIYLQAGIFFSTSELDRGSRDSVTALQQLQWFQTEVVKRGLPQKFRLSASKEALDRFTRINLTLLNNLKFQELNKLAITKILKSA